MRAHIRGHAVTYHDDAYHYADTDELAEGWGGEPRACPECGLMPVACDKGCGYQRDNSNPFIWLHDPCLGHLDGVKSACCGHGIEGADYRT